MKHQRFPRGWDEERVRRVLEHYEHQTDVEAVAEDEAAYGHKDTAMIAVPRVLVPRIRTMIARHKSHQHAV